MMNFARTILDSHLFDSYQNVTSGEINDKRQIAGRQKEKRKV